MRKMHFFIQKRKTKKYLKEKYVSQYFKVDISIYKRKYSSNVGCQKNRII